MIIVESGGFKSFIKEQIETFRGYPIYLTGHSRIDQVDLPGFNNNRKLNMAGTIQDINAWLASFPATRKSFQDICESDRTRTFGNVAKCLKFMKSIPPHASRQYVQALALFQKNKIYVENIMKQHNLDALFIPLSTAGIASYDPLLINSWQAPVSSNAGLPSMVINIGSYHDMPVGIEVVGKQFNEGTLIEIAFSYEQHSPPRKLPVMPEANLKLLDYTIPQINNLLSFIGKDTYEKVLKNGKTGELAREDLTPEIFRAIVYARLER